MGIQEGKIARRRKKESLQRHVLAAVGIAGLLGVALVAPNALILLRKEGVAPRPRLKDTIRRTTATLIQRGFLERNGDAVRLTAHGERALVLAQLKAPSVHTKRKWDGKWRMLIFDIPERRRRQREHIRNQLHSIGFARLQDSVWTFPYPCEEYVTLLKADMKIGKDLLYLIVDSIEGDASLRMHFNLPKE